MAYRDEVLKDSPVLYYSLEDQVASTTTGRRGKACSFNGTTSYIDVPDNTLIDLTNVFTIEFYVKLNNLGKEHVICDKDSIGGNTTGTFSISILPSGQIKVNRKRDKSVQSGLGIIKAGIWQHVVVTFNRSAGQTKYYVDNVYKGTSTGLTQAFTANSKPLLIGRGSAGGHLLGSLDEFAIYKKALSASRIAAHFKAG